MFHARVVRNILVQNMGKYICLLDVEFDLRLVDDCSIVWNCDKATKDGLLVRSECLTFVRCFDSFAETFFFFSLICFSLILFSVLSPKDTDDAINPWTGEQRL